MKQTRIYSARPTPRRAIVSPGERDALIVSGRRPVELPIQQLAEPDWNRNAPISKLPENFIAAMRAKGWLRS